MVSLFEIWISNFGGKLFFAISRFIYISYDFAAQKYGYATKQEYTKYCINKPSQLYNIFTYIFRYFTSTFLIHVSREMSIAILACLQLHDPKEWYTLKDDIYPVLHSHMHLFPQNSKKRAPERQIQDSLSHNKKYFNSARRLAHCNGCWQITPSYLQFLANSINEFKGIILKFQQNDAQ